MTALACGGLLLDDELEEDELDEDELDDDELDDEELEEDELAGGFAVGLDAPEPVPGAESDEALLPPHAVRTSAKHKEVSTAKTDERIWPIAHPTISNDRPGASGTRDWRRRKQELRRGNKFIMNQ